MKYLKTIAVVALVALAVGIVMMNRGGGEAAPPIAGGRSSASGLPTMSVSELPPEGRETLRLIDAGGPFPYPRDGVVFRNGERILPRQPRGFYREYTVRTPGSRDRGARRIVTGDGTRLIYYTNDHYRTFREVRR